MRNIYMILSFVREGSVYLHESIAISDKLYQYYPQSAVVYIIHGTDRRVKDRIICVRPDTADNL